MMISTGQLEQGGLKSAVGRQPRTGAVVFIALAALALASLAAVTLARTLVTHRDRLRMEEQRTEAEWIGLSALNRAAAQLRESPDYAGETWQVELGRESQQSATATIEVSTVDEDLRRRQVRVIVETGGDPTTRIRQTVETTILLHASGERR